MVSAIFHDFQLFYFLPTVESSLNIGKLILFYLEPMMFFLIGTFLFYTVMACITNLRYQRDNKKP
jgi:hypothetical protein